MAEISLIVEGKADKKFLKDFISYHYDVAVGDDDFVIVEGNVEKMDLAVPDIKSRSQAGKVNLLIFDADGDFVATLDKIQHRKKQLNLDFESFLLPNNKDPGNLETLLKQSINRNNLQLFNCIETYSTCVQQLQLESLKVINQKAKLFIYVDSFSIGGEGKEDRRNYLEDALWNLNAEALNPLKQFLNQYIT